MEKSHNWLEADLIWSAFALAALVLILVGWIPIVYGGIPQTFMTNASLAVGVSIGIAHYARNRILKRYGEPSEEERGEEP